MTPSERLKIKENCQQWANNCGGCETCSQVFSDHPLYDHQETLELIYTIEALEDRVKRLTEALKFYARHESYTPEGIVFDQCSYDNGTEIGHQEQVQDFGNIARKALEEE